MIDGQALQLALQVVDFLGAVRSEVCAVRLPSIGLLCGQMLLQRLRSCDGAFVAFISTITKCLQQRWWVLCAHLML